MTEKINNHVCFSRNLPSGLSTFHLEADRSPHGLRITVSGIIGIKGFTSEGVLLSSHAGRIFISGEKLRIEIYENKIVEISGKIGEISFGKNKD